MFLRFSRSFLLIQKLFRESQKTNKYFYALEVDCSRNFLLQRDISYFAMPSNKKGSAKKKKQGVEGAALKSSTPQNAPHVEQNRTPKSNQKVECEATPQSEQTAEQSAKPRSSQKGWKKSDQSVTPQSIGNAKHDNNSKDGQTVEHDKTPRKGGNTRRRSTSEKSQNSEKDSRDSRNTRRRTTSEKSQNSDQVSRHGSSHRKDMHNQNSERNSTPGGSHHYPKYQHKESTPGKSGLPKMNCGEYWHKQRVEEGLNNGQLIQGNFRVNQKNYSNAYITPPNSNEDILVEGLDNRNRALHGDVVVVEILKNDESLHKEVQEIIRKLADEFDNASIAERNGKQRQQPRGRVVYIKERKHSGVFAGNLKPFRNGAFGIALLSPLDSRLPRVMIPIQECPEIFLTRPQDVENVLFIGQITQWKRTCGLASGKLIKSLGDAREIEPATEGILIEKDIDYSPFSDEVVACLPIDYPWEIPKAEYESRRDLRDQCIFTIDPATARDLDDALSCKLNDDGTFEVGVHIADVSFFIEEGNMLDKVAASRATSVYLIQRVIPMLPRLLCENLCSLNPGQDKLTYSVIWTITPDGKVMSEWFGRTIIRSCSKLAYDHAQEMISTEDSESLNVEQFPAIDGGHTIKDIHAIVKHLYEISVHLRKKRFDSGALLLNQPKLSFTLDSESGLPNGCASYISKDSNRLVEEFMLLANMAVAHRLIRSHPDLALLRRHPVPNAKMMKDLSELCERSQVALDIKSSKSLHDSIQNLKASGPEKEALCYAIVSLCSKPMQLAKYFCAGAIEDETQYHHFALNVPLYTHFTSPIRRYPDIIVHRLLTAALDDTVKVKKNVTELQQQAEACNEKKAAAKECQEKSAELFLNAYVRSCGELQEKAVVVGFLDSSVDVLLLHIGMVKRVYCKHLAVDKWELKRGSGKDVMTLSWKRSEDEEAEISSSDIMEGLAVRNSKENRNKETIREDNTSKIMGGANNTSRDAKVENDVSENIGIENIAPADTNDVVEVESTTPKDITKAESKTSQEMDVEENNSSQDTTKVESTAPNEEITTPEEENAAPIEDTTAPQAELDKESKTPKRDVRLKNDNSRKNFPEARGASKEVDLTGPVQFIEMFHKVDVIVKSESMHGGPYKINVYLSRPDVGV